LLFFTERHEIAEKFDIFHEDSDVIAVSWRPWRFYGAPWRSYGVLAGDCPRSYGAPTACIELSQHAVAQPSQR